MRQWLIESHKKLTVGVPSETQTRYLPHTSLQHHHYTNQPGRQGQVMSKDNQRRDFIVVPGKTRRPTTRNTPVCHDRPSHFVYSNCRMTKLVGEYQN
jgi:hypothetical protein